MGPQTSWIRDRATLVMAVLLPLAVAVLLVPLRDHMPNTAAALVMVVSVVAVAANGHRLAGLTASVFAALWFDFFLTQPYGHFAIDQRDDVETTVLLLAVGAAVTELAVRGRRYKVAAAIDAAYIAAITSTTDLVAAGADSGTLAKHVSRQLSELLGLSGCRFELDRFGGLPVLQADGSISETHVNEAAASAGEVEVVAASHGRRYGRFVVTLSPGPLPPLAARQVASVLAAQVGAALAYPRSVDG